MYSNEVIAFIGCLIPESLIFSLKQDIGIHVACLKTLQSGNVDCNKNNSPTNPKTITRGINIFLFFSS